MNGFNETEKVASYEKESDAAEAISNLQKETDILKKQCLELQNELDRALADKEQCIRSIQEENGKFVREVPWQHFFRSSRV